MGGGDINITKLFTMRKMLWALFRYAAETSQWKGTFRELPELNKEQEKEREGRR
jgi:hypothetical protein